MENVRFGQVGGVVNGKSHQLVRVWMLDEGKPLPMRLPSGSLTRPGGIFKLVPLGDCSIDMVEITEAALPALMKPVYHVPPPAKPGGQIEHRTGWLFGAGGAAVPVTPGTNW
jgi:hypothetical protein